MSRFLFVVPPLAGHVNPAAGVAAELRQRGHDVGWVAHEAVVGSLLGEGAPVYPAGEGFLPHVVQHLAERERLKGLQALEFLWTKVLLPMAADMVEPVRAAIEDFGPDVVVTDQQAFAGGIVATELGLPWAVSACSTAELVNPLSLMPGVTEWVRHQLDTLWDQLELPGLAEAGFDPRWSPYLVLEYSTPELVGQVARDLASIAFVGPVLPSLGDPAGFPWEWLDRHGTNVYVSLGTLSHGIGERFLDETLEAVADRPYGVVIADPAGKLADVPGNVLVRPFVPQLELFPRVDAVLCHAGHNTTVGALAFGVPLVCAPIREDQPITAGQVVQAGAGVRLKFALVEAPDIAEAIDTVLGDPSYRAAAVRIAESFQAAGGAAAAADHLEAVSR